MGVRSRVAQVHQDDRGTTLAELLVGMAVMTVFMAIFTGAIVSMTKTATRVEAKTTSSSEVNNTFLRLNKLVGYATAITTPGHVAGSSGSSDDSYVEIYTVPPVTAKETCTQLWVDAPHHALRLRTWQLDSSRSGWTTLVDDVRRASSPSGSEDPPPFFALDDASTAFQQLTISFTAGRSGATTHGDMSFTALNSDASDSTDRAHCQPRPTDG